MKFETAISLSALIKMLRNNEDDGEVYCVYGKGDPNEASLDSECFLSKHPEITDDDEEIFPEFVEKHDLELWFREELLQDVVANALHQSNNVSEELILKAVKYYCNEDSFLDIMN